MPCEACTAQFTVFKRKRSCTECSRYYCNQCLTKRNNIYLCGKCLIFTKCPLHKSDLLKLKVKDLIFYLQSKHISTTGCVEKDELVNLILIHVNNNSSNGSSQYNCQTDKNLHENDSNTFNNLKQSCQSFFTTVTEKIAAADFNFVDLRKTPASSPASSTSTNTPLIDHQPDIITRDLHSFSSSLSQNIETENLSPSHNNKSPTHKSSYSLRNNSASNSSSSSPLNGCSSITTPDNSNSCNHTHIFLSNPIINSKSPPDRLTFQKENENVSVKQNKFLKNELLKTNDTINNSSGCECSDDEIIVKFQANKNMPKVKVTKVDLEIQHDAAGPSGSSSSNSASGCSNTKISTVSNQNFDDSSGSSFEELGAVGGSNGEGSSNVIHLGSSSSGSTITSTSDNEHWQFVNTDKNNLKSNNAANNSEQNKLQCENNRSDLNSEKSLILFDENSSRLPGSAFNNLRFHGITPGQQRIMRRRSDGFIYNRQNIPYEETIELRFNLSNNRRNISRVDEEDSEDSGDVDRNAVNGESGSGSNTPDKVPISRNRFKKNCAKCGKNKKSLKYHVNKFRKQLEKKKLSESEIKNELEEFLDFLDCRQNSLDCSDDSETNSDNLPDAEIGQRSDNEYELRFTGDNDGIHVYASNDSKCYGQSRFDNRFLCLQDFKSIDDFEELTVKQLKEILMLNRVDFKGCCEKQELLDRVHRLWKNFQGSPAVEKLKVDDLCKICMDAPIECVILECGHMATCTGCGKVLSECPICRQYIVRVVRFFRA